MTLSGSSLMEERKSRITKWHARSAKPYCLPESPLAAPDCIVPTEAAADPAPAAKEDIISKPAGGPIESFVIALEPQAIRAFKISYKNIPL